MQRHSLGQAVSHASTHARTSSSCTRISQLKADARSMLPRTVALAQSSRLHGE